MTEPPMSEADVLAVQLEARRRLRRWRRHQRLHVCPFCRGRSWMTGWRLLVVWACAAMVAMAVLNGWLHATVWLLLKAQGR